jgi:hypothetical protein
LVVGQRRETIDRAIMTLVVDFSCFHGGAVVGAIEAVGAVRQKCMLHRELQLLRKKSECLMEC